MSRTTVHTEPRVSKEEGRLTGPGGGQGSSSLTAGQLDLLPCVQSTGTPSFPYKESTAQTPLCVEQTLLRFGDKGGSQSRIQTLDIEYQTPMNPAPFPPTGLPPSSEAQAHSPVLSREVKQNPLPDSFSIGAARRSLSRVIFPMKNTCSLFPTPPPPHLTTAPPAHRVRRRV